MIDEHAKHFIDAGAIGSGVAVLAGILPTATIILSFVLVALRVYSAILDARIKRKELNDGEPKN